MHIPNVDFVEVALKDPALPLEEKCAILRESISLTPEMEHFLTKCSGTEEYTLLLLQYLGQSHLLVHGKLDDLVAKVVSLERAFIRFGGVIGYQKSVETVLAGTETRYANIQAPSAVSLESPCKEVTEYIHEAICRLGEFCEMYPVGGAADRLQLTDPETGVPLPAARLGFLGKGLLEGIIGDVQAREYLHYKLFGKQLQTPIALMTSTEKNNHAHIVEICENTGWFGRQKEHFFLFTQPMVPCVDRKGAWQLTEHGELLTKPGGHGSIWLMAQEKKVFHFFERCHRTKIHLRQINNPIAGVDYGVLAFLGYGLRYEKGFGFCGCPRNPGLKEGMNVIAQSEEGAFLTNIEYCEFESYNVEDESAFSAFPANTNILFADIRVVQEAIEKNPFPGKILNFSKKIQGEASTRLETMMQNIADSIPAEKTFVTTNVRRKTIASAKKSYVPGSGIAETPLGALCAHFFNMVELFTHNSKWEIPLPDHSYNFEKDGPLFHCTYHPSLGPLFSVIAQKLVSGKISEGSCMIFDCADLYVENLELNGSLVVEAKNAMGHFSQGILHYSEKTGRCILRNVAITTGASKKNELLSHMEEVVDRGIKIVLEGNSEFIAENVVFTLRQEIVVPDGKKITARMEGKEVVFLEESLWEEGPLYTYSFNNEKEVTVTLNRC